MDEDAPFHSPDAWLSKKVEKHAAMVCLHFMHYNFGRVHSSLGRLMTPAMAPGVSDHVWTCHEIEGLLD